MLTMLSMAMVKIAFDNDIVNTLVGTCTDYARIATVHDGTVFVWIATVPNGGQAVKIGSQVG